MDKIIDMHFERVERALTTLITSISTYNPSPALAHDLVAADAELSQGLSQLSIHQTNHAKLLALRNTSEALDTQIKETLVLLTTTRSELLALPAVTPPANTNPVSYSELLSYARRISKFTLPSTFRESTDAATTAAIEGSDGAGGGTGTQTPRDVLQQTNGTGAPNTPVTAGANAAPSAIGGGGAGGATTANGVESAGSQVALANANNTQTSQTSLPSEITQWLNPLSDLPFIPWPSEETIRNGALASLQILTDQGIDPATFDPEQSAALEEERKRIVEEEDRLRAERRARMEEEQLQRRRDEDRRLSAAPGPNDPSAASAARTERPAFHVEMFDDDEED